MDEDLELTAKEAIKYAADYFGVPSKYAMAQQLSDEVLTVQPIQITNYLKGTKMSRKVADRFFATYGIVITDAYTPSDWATTHD